MRNRSVWLNIYLAFAIAIFNGCVALKKKEATQLHLFIEVTPDGTDRNAPVTIGQTQPFVVNVENQFFLDEASIAHASVVDGVGGFEIMLQFDRRGTWVLEQYSVAHRGRRIAIFANFDIKRWLAAPTIARRITDGVLVFTPDATREEAERIVLGLNNLAKELQKNNP